MMLDFKKILIRRAGAQRIFVFFSAHMFFFLKKRLMIFPKFINDFGKRCFNDFGFSIGKIKENTKIINDCVAARFNEFNDF